MNNERGPSKPDLSCMAAKVDQDSDVLFILREEASLLCCKWSMSPQKANKKNHKRRYKATETMFRSTTGLNSRSIIQTISTQKQSPWTKVLLQTKQEGQLFEYQPQQLRDLIVKLPSLTMRMIARSGTITPLGRPAVPINIFVGIYTKPEVYSKNCPTHHMFET